MLRSPLELLGQNRRQTVGIVAVMAVALWLVAALSAAVYQVQAGAQTWFDQFVPVVYLDPGVAEAEATALRDEIDDWSGARQVELEDAAQTLQRLEETLGADELERMGVTERMAPARLMIYPELWRPGQLEVIARAQALEERELVLATDAPEAGALQWLQRGRWVALGAVLAVAVGLIGAVAMMAMWLRSLQYSRRRELYLLEVFGASSRSLRIASLWRGVAVGVVAAVIAALGFVPWSLVVDGFVADVAGESVMSPLVTALWASVLLVAGTVLGAAAGWFASRPPADEKEPPEQRLLDWPRESAL